MLSKPVYNPKNCYVLFGVALFILSLSVQMLYAPVHCGDDFYFHMRRFKALALALGDGSFPFYTDYTAAEGYGYLSNVFYPNLILIPFAALATFIDYLPAYRLMLFSMTILCGIFMYHAVHKIYKCHFVAFASSLLYTFSAYRLFDLYQRAALGETLSFTFLPLVFLGLYYILFDNAFRRKWYVIAIGFTFMIFSHILASVLTFFLVLLIVIIAYKRIFKEPRRLLFLVAAGIVTIFLTSAFLFPLLEQMLSGNFFYETNQWALPHKSKLSIQALAEGLIPLWKNNAGTIPSIGIILCAGVLLRLFVRSGWKNNGLLKYTDIGVICGFCCIVVSSAIFPWGRFPFNHLSYIQFPWRLFEFTTFFFSIASGFYISILLRESKQRLIACIFLILLCIGSIILHSSAYRAISCREKEYLENTTMYDYDLGGGFEYMPAKFGSPFRVAERKDTVRYQNADTRVFDFTRAQGSTSFGVECVGEEVVELPLFYYKGYAARMEGEVLKIKESKNGLLEVFVSRSGIVCVHYEGTNIQKASWIITLVSSLLFCFCVLRTIRTKK